MHRSLIAAAAGAVAFTSIAHAHAIFPGSQTVRTVGDRAFVRFQAVNARRDVSDFTVEIFQGDSWVPSRLAVASPPRLKVPAPDPGSLESFDRPFSILVDLDGQSEQKLRVCTKSILPYDRLRPLSNKLNTRVCANVTVKRF